MVRHFSFQNDNTFRSKFEFCSDAWSLDIPWEVLLLIPLSWFPMYFTFPEESPNIYWAFLQEVYCVCLNAVNFLCSSLYGAEVCIFDQSW